MEKKAEGLDLRSSLLTLGKTDASIVLLSLNRNLGPGFHRQVCIDRMEFNDDGTIRRGKPTQKGVRALK